MTPAQFRTTCDALGGQRRVAELTNRDERTIRYFIAGTRPIPSLVSKLLVKALYDHADKLAQLARTIKL